MNWRVCSLRGLAQKAEIENTRGGGHGCTRAGLSLADFLFRAPISGPILIATRSPTTHGHTHKRRGLHTYDSVLFYRFFRKAVYEKSHWSTTLCSLQLLPSAGSEIKANGPPRRVLPSADTLRKVSANLEGCGVALDLEHRHRKQQPAGSAPFIFPSSRAEIWPKQRTVRLF